MITVTDANKYPVLIYFNHFLLKGICDKAKGKKSA